MDNYGFFNSPSVGKISWSKALRRIVKFMGQETTASYEVIIGTDSEVVHGVADFVSAIIVHRKGGGGVYYWARQKQQNMHSLHQRIMHEALTSLELAQKVTEEFSSIGLLGLDLEIHVDIGPNGQTREMISEIVGMIRANGFKVATKPDSWGASHVADRHV